MKFRQEMKRGNSVFIGFPTALFPTEQITLIHNQLAVDYEQKGFKMFKYMLLFPIIQGNDQNIKWYNLAYPYFAYLNLFLTKLKGGVSIA